MASPAHPLSALSPIARAAHHLGLIAAVALARVVVARWPLAASLRALAALDRARPDRAEPLPPSTLLAFERAARRAARLLHAPCLPTALALRAWLRLAAGQPARLVIALRSDRAASPEGAPPLGHAWLRVDTADGVLPLLHGPHEDHGPPIEEPTLRAALRARGRAT